MNKPEQAQVLKLSLHGRLVGYLAGFSSGRNVLSFASEFKEDPSRPTFSLVTHPKFARAKKLLAGPWVRNQRLPPTVSNLLPEGALRELIAQGLKTHIDNEFQIFSYLGQDLPGALIATPMEPDEVPEAVVRNDQKAKLVKLQATEQGNRFSLAGVQLKFSMKEKDGRYNLTNTAGLGDWIIKTPSPKHKNLPLNEYTSMKLAALAGVDIPEIKLVELNKLDSLAQMNLPDERLAFAIKRFDRDGTNQRIHMEDFAQVLMKTPHEKYTGANYQQIGRILYQFSGDGLADVQQFARRLLVNILLANGDAHLKNWSLLYSDQITPRLSPAYDILTTSLYIEDEAEFALNLGKSKQWFEVTLGSFEFWAEKSNIPWRAIRPHLIDTIERARSLWPEALKDLPVDDTHKKALKIHWQRLQTDFKISDN